MVNLVRCEFWKLKRRPFLFFFLLLAVFFPAAMTPFSMYYPRLQDLGPADLYDSCWQSSICYSSTFVLPCLLGIITAILFFSERDNDTYKNLRVIPVGITKLILAKFAVMLLFSVVFCLLSTLFNFAFALLVPARFAITEPLYDIAVSLLSGVVVTLGTMPLILLVLYFGSNFTFSIIITIFYSVINMYLLSFVDKLPTLFLQWVPNMVITLWFSDTVSAHMKINGQHTMDALKAGGAILSTGQMFVHLAILGLVFGALIITLYKKREGRN